ncbi:bifunctional 2-polyprenyl-6-hydroxyphenol methylase/3-demethylubiquinol 3-O-methyltransferase UbiG [Lutibacter sp.]|uniref:class I SAM-dependent methyltransferase n=1 Tax=Lutibacter sp. TaxID=1925666 RepID=UPI0027348544|nr:class I SAM-dependent methyltransferase [Lutibacter sp.]MDP3312621.1 class I SAM-dependent methyltransferase [Lutibacter sp.]
MTKNINWFISWFNSKYYHILYKHRDDKEADIFMRNLISFLKLKKEEVILDLACGKGRHAIFLNSLGFNVVGADLSTNSIQKAKKKENERLRFIEHDMRNPFPEKYNTVLNLFTSFGFFEEDSEDITVLKNIKNSLEKDGIAVIDFMNALYVVKYLVPNETLIIDGITFNITKYVENGFIIKKIVFEAEGDDHTYFEKVKILDLPKIKGYLQTVGFKIKHTFGNYQLDNFDEHTSKRLILVLE